MNVNQRNVKDFEYILAEIERVALACYSNGGEGFVKFVSSEPLLSALCTMPCDANVNGEIIIGASAHEKFYEIANRILAPTKRKRIRSIASDQFVKYLKIEFSKAFISQGVAITESTVTKVLNKAKRSASGSCESLVHYIPMKFFRDYKGEEIDFGPIKVIGLVEFEKKVLSDAMPEGDLYHLTRNNLDKYIEGCNAVLVIPVEACQHSISIERAELVGEVFVALMHLFYGREYTTSIRCAGDREPLKTNYKIYKSELGVQWQMDTVMPRSIPDWSELLSGDNPVFLTLYYKVISQVIKPNEEDVVCKRLIDAILWFGEASKECNDLSRVVKYSTALERVLAPETNDIFRNISERASKLIDIFEGDRDKWKTVVKKMYDLRSKIVHGDIEFSERISDSEVLEYEGLTARVIMASVVFYEKIGLESLDSAKTIGKYYIKLEQL